MINSRIGELKKERLFTFLIVLMAWANTYNLPWASIGVGEFLLIICIPFYYKKNTNFSLNFFENGFVLWFVYVIFLTLILFNLLDAHISKFLLLARESFYWIVIFILGKNLFNLKYFKKMILAFAVLLSIFIIVQSVVYSISGYLIPGFFLNAPLKDGGLTGMEMYERYLQLAKWYGFARPNGFLCEPAHCSQFLFVCLLCFIMDSTKSFAKKNALILLISIAMLMTFSTTGIALLFFSWFIYIIVEKRLSYFRIPVAFLFILSVIVLVCGMVNVGNNAIDRIVNIFDGKDIDGSSNVRLNNGLKLFMELPMIMKLFGTGMGMFDYVSSYLSFEDVNSYMNTFSIVLFMSGFCGFFIWNISLVVMFIKSSLLGKSLVVGFFLMTLGCSIFCQAQMVWIFLIILADIEQKKMRFRNNE